MKRKLISLFLALAIVISLCQPVPAQAAAAEEYKGVWFSYYDFENYLDHCKANTAANFTAYFRTVVSNCKSKGFNRIIVQVRPFSDAIYKSAYFPTSACIAGKQGKAISYDPLAIMVTEAHNQGLKIEAWINPYRVSTNTSYKKLAKSNPARKWHASKKASTRRNVLSYGGRLYYNPSKPAVRNLIVNGVKEIVANYAVDGIHMDDYFYPSFSSKTLKKSFDAKEWKASKEKKAGMSIQTYRRKQVSTLVANIKTAVKSIRPSCTFGISPAGEIDNLTSKYSYYVDITTWCKSDRYVDYIAPQVYWGFQHRTSKYDRVVNRWLSITDRSKVKLYIGLPAYKMGYKSAGTTSGEKSELVNSATLSKMINYGRAVGANGFIVFDYSDVMRSSIKTAIANMAAYLKLTK